MRRCRVCEHPINDGAQLCPHCEADQHPPPSSAPPGPVRPLPLWGWVPAVFQPRRYRRVAAGGLRRTVLVLLVLLALDAAVYTIVHLTIMQRLVESLAEDVGPTGALPVLAIEHGRAALAAERVQPRPLGVRAPAAPAAAGALRFAPGEVRAPTGEPHRPPDSALSPQPSALRPEGEPPGEPSALRQAQGEREKGTAPGAPEGPSLTLPARGEGEPSAPAPARGPRWEWQHASEENGVTICARVVVDLSPQPAAPALDPRYWQLLLTEEGLALQPPSPLWWHAESPEPARRLDRPLRFTWAELWPGDPARRVLDPDWVRGAFARGLETYGMLMTLIVLAAMAALKTLGVLLLAPLVPLLSRASRAAGYSLPGGLRLTVLAAVPATFIDLALTGLPLSVMLRTAIYLAIVLHVAYRVTRRFTERELFGAGDR